MRTALDLAWGITRGLLGLVLVAAIGLGFFVLPVIVWIGLMILLLLIGIFVRLGRLSSH
jgi:hypothetical protein